MALHEAKIIFVTSVKGGTGKTTTVLNLAGVFAKRKKKVLILDFDLYTGAIAAALNLNHENDLFTLVDDLNNNRFHNLEDYITTYQKEIDVIAAPKDPRSAGKINSKYLHIVLGKARYKYDIILIDSHPALTSINLVTMDEADQILYVITNDPIDFKNMRTMVSIFRDMERNHYQIILNEALSRHHYFTTYDIKHLITDNIDFTLPSSLFTKAMPKLILDGKIPSLDPGYVRKHKKGMDHYEKIASALLKEKKKQV